MKAICRVGTRKKITKLSMIVAIILAFNLITPNLFHSFTEGPKYL
jgi:hypothetical protein